MYLPSLTALNQPRGAGREVLGVQVLVAGEYRKVEEQEATMTQLKKDFRATVAQLTTRLDEQAAQIQKVSAQLEASKPAPQMFVNE
jgi:hypothetical protein